MIFISSSCVKRLKIVDSVRTLAQQGFTNIELSGGTDYYENYLNELIELKKEYNLNLLIHNYFPPPKQHFVLNLASLNNDIFKKTIDHFKNSLDLARKLEVDRIGIHAGYFVDPETNELGKSINKICVNNKTKAIDRFVEGYRILKEFAGDIKIYIENNVISFENYKTYHNNPFMLTNLTDYYNLQKILDFPLLLDIAHLYVSCNTLRLSFEDELTELFQHSDYIHISDNNGLADSNLPLSQNGNIFLKLSQLDLDKKKITLEIYDVIDKIKNSYRIIKNRIM